MNEDIRILRLVPTPEETEEKNDEEKPGPRGRKEPPRREPPGVQRMPPPTRDMPVPPLPGGQTEL